MVNGNGNRQAPGFINIAANFRQDERKIFYGMGGYLSWISFQRSANARMSIEDFAQNDNRFTFNYRTWANSQTRIIEAVAAIIKPGTLRFSECVVLFN
jgi:hypothetical protein